MVRVRLLGGLTLEVDGRRVELPSGRVRSLLAWLALNPGMHRRGALAERFWPGAPEASGRASLRTALWSLRRALEPAGEASLVTRRDAVELTGEPAVWVDARAAEALVGAGRLEEAAGLLEGELAPELDDDWMDEERDRLRTMLARVLARLARAA